MASSNCTCDDNSLGNLGRPKCVNEMPAIAFPIFWPRFDENGQRNEISVNTLTVGADIKALIEIGGAFRIYPSPKTENVTAERTETAYETFPSGRKVKIQGVGGIRTFSFELIGKDAVNAILRELERYGCSDLDFGLVDVNGGLWLHKDNPISDSATGFKMDSETFDAFKVYATDTTTGKIMMSFDMDRFEKESEGYVLTADDLGYPATTLSGLISAYSISEAVTTTTAIVSVYDGFGTASDVNEITGLLSANFTAFNVTDNSSLVVTAVESGVGIYTLTYTAPTSGDIIRVDVTATGYEVSNSTFESL